MNGAFGTSGARQGSRLCAVCRPAEPPAPADPWPCVFSQLEMELKMLKSQPGSAESSFPFCREEVDTLRYAVLGLGLLAVGVY